MKDEKEKLEIKKKPQQVNKEELDKVAGGGCAGAPLYKGCCYTVEK